MNTARVNTMKRRHGVHADLGSLAGQINVFVNGTVAHVLIDVAGFYQPVAEPPPVEQPSVELVVARSSSVDEVDGAMTGSFFVALSVEVVAESAGIIQTDAGVQVLTTGADGQFFCRLTLGEGVTTNSGDADLGNTDRGEYVPPNQTGSCSAEGTMQALFVPWGTLEIVN